MKAKVWNGLIDSQLHFETLFCFIVCALVSKTLSEITLRKLDVSKDIGKNLCYEAAISHM